MEKIEAEEEAEEICLDYEEVCGHTFYLVAACDHYSENENGTFTYLEDSMLHEEELMDRALPLKIVGVVRPSEDASNADVSTAVAYTSELTDYLIATRTRAQ